LSIYLSVYLFVHLSICLSIQDDANHDPQWSEQQIVSAAFKFNGLTIGQEEIDMMRRTTVVVFEVLERAWSVMDCTLVDMKIEFGVDNKGEFNKLPLVCVLY